MERRRLGLQLLGSLLLTGAILAGCAKQAVNSGTTPGAASGETKAPAPAAAPAPAYPTKAIDLIVSFGPGGAADVTARLIAKFAAEKFGQPVNVVNVPGGSGVVGTQQALSAKPDGYTLLVDNHAVSSLLAVTQKSLPFMWEERTWIARVTRDPIFYVVKTDTPYKTLADVVSKAKADPKSFKWGSCGASCISSFGTGALFDLNGIELKQTNMVVFKSGGETLTGLASGSIDLAAQQLSEVTPLIGAGKIRPLAVVAEKRLAQYPDVPTAKELNIAVEISGWQGISGPNGIPDHVVAKWQEFLAAAIKDPAFLDQAGKISKIIDYLPGEQMKKAAVAEKEKYQPLSVKLGFGQ
jgi:tripartite-type tricarboxylate transporter receptor subunit TctC